MEWTDRQARLTEEARLLTAPPQMVFDELRVEAQKARENRFQYHRAEGLEARLVERSDRLINLGLASYGLDKDVFKALYKFSLEPAQDETDARYKLGLRLACLSNTALPVVTWVWRFPHELVGNEEVERILVGGQWSEIEALLGNPHCSDQMLEHAFTGEGSFAGIPEQRRAHLLHVVAKNERLNRNRDNSHDPDLGHYGIHRGIKHLVEHSPVSSVWFWAVWTVIENLDPQYVDAPENVGAMLARWKDFEIYDVADDPAKRKPSEAHTIPHITLAEEFRCALAAVFGKGLAKEALKAAAKSEYLPMRCAYYAHADLTRSEMKAGYERDRLAYVFAAAYNSSIAFKRDTRNFFEEEQMSGGGNLARIYRRNIEYMRKWYRHMPAAVSEFNDDPDEEVRPAAPLAEMRERVERVEADTAAVRRNVDSVMAGLKSIQKLIYVAAGLYIAYSLFKSVSGTH